MDPRLRNEDYVPHAHRAEEVFQSSASPGMIDTPVAGPFIERTMLITEEQVREALKAVKYPGYSRDIISFGLVKGIAIQGDSVTVVVQMNSPQGEVAQTLRTEVERALGHLSGVRKVSVDLRQSGSSAAASTPEPNRVPGISKVVAVASGKGGVGKSTVSVNLACGLTHLGKRVGLLDCDIYGPSIPLMMGVHEKPTVSDAEKMVPPVGHGVKVMSIGLLLDGDQPVIWRGPMITKTIQQFIGSVEWGELDVLLVDLPPGTGDAQLSLCQTVPLDGGVVVTTPQEASLGIVRKGIGMFNKVNVPILGIVENMSYFTTPSGERFEIFGHGGGRAEAERQGVPFLGEVPMFQEIRIGGDKGLPVVVDAPESAPAKAFLTVCDGLLRALTR